LPDGTKVIYKVMQDYINIDGIRVPMTGVTAQRIADHFGMNLPTTKMSKQIWQAADAKLPPAPMSAGGKIGDKYYSGQEVVSHKISDSDTAVAFNERINQQLQDKRNAKLYAGHMKDIIQPDDPNRLGITGWYHPDGTPIQKGNISSHDIHNHSEYASGARLVADEVTVIKDGKTINTTLDKLLSDKSLSKAVTLDPGKGVKKYNAGITSTTKPEVKSEPKIDPQSTFEPVKPQNGRLQFLQRIENFLNSIMGK
jgi:hypothetical protein